ncbi:MAG: antitoxin component YwqK of YwqJK toxin-antitoxin module [Saprospiraceae bacterium]|jgi:antitoxin component YwqK of YwqJK toxin-antitoxin module
MKKYFLITILSFVSLLIVGGQSMTNKSTAADRENWMLYPTDSLSDGVWSMYYESDSLLYGIFPFLNGNKQGPFTIYYKSGGKMMEGFFDTDTLVKQLSQFTEDGQLLYRETIIGDSVMTECWSLEGNKISEKEGRQLLSDYPFYIQYEKREIVNNGEIEYESGPTEEGGKYSFWRKWDSDNKLIEEGHYKNDIKVGMWRYYENGNILTTGLYNELGKKIGDWKVYNEDGTRQFKSTSTGAGKMIGFSLAFTGVVMLFLYRKKQPEKWNKYFEKLKRMRKCDIFGLLSLVVLVLFTCGNYAIEGFVLSCVMNKVLMFIGGISLIIFFVKHTREKHKAKESRKGLVAWDGRLDRMRTWFAVFAIIIWLLMQLVRTC